MTAGVGTFNYMAPEMFAVSDKYGNGVDVYTLAILAQEILTGEVPFRGMTDPQVMYMVLEGRRPPVPPEWPQKIRDVLASGWHQNAAQRCTAAQFRDLFAAAAEKTESEP